MEVEVHAQAPKPDAPIVDMIDPVLPNAIEIWANEHGHNSQEEAPQEEEGGEILIQTITIPERIPLEADGTRDPFERDPPGSEEEEEEEIGSDETRFIISDRTRTCTSNLTTKQQRKAMRRKGHWTHTGR